MNKQYVVWDDINRKLDEIVAKDIWSDIKAICGIPTGGAIIAHMLWQKLRSAGMDIKLCYPENSKFVTTNPNELLIVDDLIDSGRTMEPWVNSGCQIYVPYVKPHSPHWPDIHIWPPDVMDAWLVFPWENDEVSGPEDAVVRSLEFIGEDPNREGLVETPARVIRAWEEIFSGYKQDPKELIKTFESDGYDQIVLLRDIELYSMCEHHMLPFTGRAHVAYIPKGKVIGISKLARLVDIYARRLQIQERLGEQVTSFLMEHLDAAGATCVIEAEHMCMRMRGISKQHSTMVTSSMKGVFLTNQAARSELMSLIHSQHN